MSRPAGHVDPRELARRARRRRAARRARRCRAWGWRPGRRTARPPRARGAACAARRGRAPRRRARGRRAAARGRRRSTLTTSSPSSAPIRSDGLGDRRVADDEHARRGQHRLEEHLDRAARQARVLDGTAPSSAADLARAALAVLGERQDPQQHARRSASACSAYARTLCSAHTPPTKPSIVPSASTSATLPGSTLAGRCARTTVAVTNAAPSAASSSARRERAAVIIAAARAAPASPPTRAPGCTACRRARRRASRTARRSRRSRSPAASRRWATRRRPWRRADGAGTA